MNEKLQPSGTKQAIAVIPMQQRIPKRWQEAKRKYRNTVNQLQNETVESAYHQLLYKVKQLLKQQATQTVFEKDFRYDNAQDAFCLHAFVSTSIYLYVECSADYRYRIEYAFNLCVHEAAIRELLKAYIFTERTKEIQLKPSYTEFYKRVLSVQDSKHIYTYTT
jgi:hypothetical protein